MIRAMYEDTKTKVKLNGRESNAFSVRVGVHQGSVLSPLLFIIVLRLCLESSGRVCLWKCFMLMAELEELLVEKLRKWKKRDGIKES